MAEKFKSQLNEVYDDFNSLRFYFLTELACVFLDVNEIQKSYTKLTKISKEYAGSELYFTIENESKLLKLLYESNWWVIPYFDVDFYSNLTKIKNLNKTRITEEITNPFIKDPSKLKDMIDKWNITNSLRKKIIYQAFNSYTCENYEICIIAIVLQLEGILKENKGDHNIHKLNKNMSKTLNETEDSYIWKSFLIAAGEDFFDKTMEALYRTVDLTKKEKDSRHTIGHTGLVPKANQVLAIKYFLMIDTLMFYLKEIKN